MYAVKTAQEEHKEAELAVKAFDRNNDALPLEQRIEEVAPQPQPKLPLNARMYRNLSRLPRFLGGNIFDEHYKGCLLDIETRELWEGRRKVLNALEDSYVRYYRDNSEGLKSSIANLEEQANSLSERIQAKYEEIYGEPSNKDQNQKPKKRHNPEITIEDVKAFKDQEKQEVYFLEDELRKKKNELFEKSRFGSNNKVCFAPREGISQAECSRLQREVDKLAAEVIDKRTKLIHDESFRSCFFNAFAYHCKAVCAVALGIGCGYSAAIIGGDVDKFFQLNNHAFTNSFFYLGLLLGGWAGWELPTHVWNDTKH